MNALIACTTCANNFSDAGGPNAASWSIMFLLVVILLMLGGIGFFMVRIARREHEALDPELRDDPPAALPHS
jgi:hypothetical protein